MCGIGGVVRADDHRVDLDTLGRMAAALRHRGPDGYGFFLDGGVGLTHVRLAILDRVGGAQPMRCASGRVVVSFNGEIFNHQELRQQLTARGCHFRTRGDTEVLLHGWIEWGESMLSRLEGQFAFALYDAASGRLVLARDRQGIRPLFYSATPRGTLVFASEMKALLASGEIDAEPDPAGLDEVMSLWSARAPRTPLVNVSQLPAGSLLRWERGAWSVSRWYERNRVATDGDPVAAVDTLLRAAVRERLQADVPVGAFLSGGLDSTIVTALASAESTHPLHTFSIAFESEQYDERVHQEAVARAFGTRHHSLVVSVHDMAQALPEVLVHAESPLLRTAPVPLYLLAAHARDHGVPVVLSGEGADELFLGYDLFKEVKLRLFCLRRPDSEWRQRLLARLYPYQGSAAARRGPFWRSAFLDAGSTDDPLFSHQPRIRAANRLRACYTPEWAACADAASVLDALRDALPSHFASWTPLERAAWLEEELLLGNHLLAAQGDRVTLAHGVEGRYPFLDRRVAEFARGLPEVWRLPGLKEKYILHAWGKRFLDPAVPRRAKQPYRAPGLGDVLLANRAPEWLHDALSPECARAVGIFQPTAVAGLARRASLAPLSARDEQMLVGIATTHLWHERVVRARWTSLAPLAASAADVVHLPAYLAVA